MTSGEISFLIIVAIVVAAHGWCLYLAHKDKDWDE